MPFDPLLVLLFGVLVVMIFFTWRSSRKRRADAEELQSSLVPGAEIMTQHGIFGTLISVDEDSNQAVVETTPGVLLRLHRQTISRVVPDETAEPEDEADETSADPELADETAPDEGTESTGTRE